MNTIFDTTAPSLLEAGQAVGALLPGSHGVIRSPMRGSSVSKVVPLKDCLDSVIVGDCRVLDSSSNLCPSLLVTAASGKDVRSVLTVTKVRKGKTNQEDMADTMDDQGILKNSNLIAELKREQVAGMVGSLRCSTQAQSHPSCDEVCELLAAETARKTTKKKPNTNKGTFSVSAGSGKGRTEYHCSMPGAVCLGVCGECCLSASTGKSAPSLCPHSVPLCRKISRQAVATLVSVFRAGSSQKYPQAVMDVASAVASFTGISMTSRCPMPPAPMVGSVGPSTSSSPDLHLELDLNLEEDDDSSFSFVVSTPVIGGYKAAGSPDESSSNSSSDEEWCVGSPASSSSYSTQEEDSDFCSPLLEINDVSVVEEEKFFFRDSHLCTPTSSLSLSLSWDEIEMDQGFYGNEPSAKRCPPLSMVEEESVFFQIE